MKAKHFLPLVVLLGAFFSCNVRTVKSPKIAQLDAKSFLKNISHKDEVFVGSFKFDSTYDIIRFNDQRGGFTDVLNDGSQNCIVCRYDTATLGIIWVTVIMGKGDREKATQAIVDAAHNAVYVMGYFQDTAIFPSNDTANHQFRIASHGGIDMFVVKYAYDTGILQWVTSGGGAEDDVLIELSNGQLIEATKLTLDSGIVHATACFGGQCYFGDTAVVADSTGSLLRVGYDGNQGLLKDVSRIKL